MGNCLWCYFRLLFVSLAFIKCKRVCNILKIILVLGFCPRKTKLLDPLSDFDLTIYVFHTAIRIRIAFIFTQILQVNYYISVFSVVKFVYLRF